MTTTNDQNEEHENPAFATRAIVDGCRHYKLIPISVPPDWTPEQDLLFFEERCGCDAEDYAEVLRSEMYFHCGGLVAVLDAALTYFYSKDLTLFPFPPECLNVTEKIDILESIVSASPRETSYHDRFKADLSLCRWAEAERHRIFVEHHKSRGKSWLYPVVAVIDLCGAAAFDLEESMVCEHEDFVGPLLG
jgi:hypothetical protein